MIMKVFMKASHKHFFFTYNSIYYNQYLIQISGMSLQKINTSTGSTISTCLARFSLQTHNTLTVDKAKMWQNSCVKALFRINYIFKIII